MLLSALRSNRFNMLLPLCSIFFIVLVKAVPHYLPPQELLERLPPNWHRGIPLNLSKTDIAADSLPRDLFLSPRYKNQGASQTSFEACLLSHASIQGGDGFAHQEAFQIITPTLNSSEVYFDASQSDNLRFHYHPRAIVYPKTAEEISQSIKCAVNHGNVAVVARSGGHSFGGEGSGGQDGALIIDMLHFDQVELRGETAIVGAGVRLGDVVKELWKYKKGFSHGTCPPVGMGGHASCGGFGPTSRLWGMTTDAIQSVEAVLADGKIVTVEPTGAYSDLLKPIKGAGSNFAIITKFHMKTFDASGPHVFLEYRWLPALQTAQEAAAVITAVQDFSQDNLPAGMGFHLQLQDGGVPAAAVGGGTLSIHLRGMFTGSLEHYRTNVINKLWEQLQRHGGPFPSFKNERSMDYYQIMEEWDDFGEPGHKLDTQAERLRRNNFLARTHLTLGQRGFTQGTMEKLFQVLLDRSASDRLRKEKGDVLQYAWNIYMEMYGGSNARHRDPDIVAATSFPHRDALWLIQASVGTYGEGAMPYEAIQWVHELDGLFSTALSEDSIGRAGFPCYVDATLADDQWPKLYFGNGVDELKRTKRKYDPWNTLRSGQSLMGKYSLAPNRAGEEAAEVTSGSKINHDTGNQKVEGYMNVHPLPRGVL